MEGKSYSRKSLNTQDVTIKTLNKSSSLFSFNKKTHEKPFFLCDEMESTMNTFKSDFSQKTSQIHLKTGNRSKPFKKIHGKSLIVKEGDRQSVFSKGIIENERSQDDEAQKLAQRKITENIMWKTKLNLEISLTRSVLKSFAEKNEEKENNLSKHKNLSLIIYPNEAEQQRKKGKCVLRLVSDFQTRIRFILKMFQKNQQISKIKQSYCLKVYQASRQRYQQFIKKLRLIVKLEKEFILENRKKNMEKILNKCFQRRDRVLLYNLQTCHTVHRVRKIIKERKSRFQEQYKENQNILQKSKSSDCFFTLKLETLDISPIKTERQKEKSEVKEVPIQTSYKYIFNEQKSCKIKLLKRIILKRHLQKWHFHARFRRNLQMCAIKFACGSKISIQKSFWRLNINAYHKQ